MFYPSLIDIKDFVESVKVFQMLVVASGFVVVFISEI